MRSKQGLISRMPPASRTGIGNKGPSGHRRALRKRAPGIINRHATTRTQKVHDQDISNAPSRLFRFAADPAISATTTTSNNAAKRAPRAARPPQGARPHQVGEDHRLVGRPHLVYNSLGGAGHRLRRADWQGASGMRPPVPKIIKKTPGSQPAVSLDAGRLSNPARR